MQRRAHTSSYRDAGNVGAAALAGFAGYVSGRERIFYLVAAIAGASVHSVFFIDEDDIDAGIAACVLAIFFWAMPETRELEMPPNNVTAQCPFILRERRIHDSDVVCHGRPADPVQSLYDAGLVWTSSLYQFAPLASRVSELGRRIF